MTLVSQLNNPNWPFPIHNGQRTEASSNLLKFKTFEKPPETLLEYLHSDPVRNTQDEQTALM
jgi:hypothetical protein